MNGKESLETEFDKENCPDHCYAESIELPAEERIKNLHNAKKFAVDIGMLFGDKTFLMIFYLFFMMYLGTFII